LTVESACMQRYCCERALKNAGLEVLAENIWVWSASLPYKAIVVPTEWLDVYEWRPTLD